MNLGQLNSARCWLGAVLTFAIALPGCRVPRNANFLIEAEPFATTEQPESQHPRSPRNRIAKRLAARPGRTNASRQNQEGLHDPYAEEVFQGISESLTSNQAMSPPATSSDSLSTEPSGTETRPTVREKNGVSFSLSDKEDSVQELSEPRLNGLEPVEPKGVGESRTPKPQSSHPDAPVVLASHATETNLQDFEALADAMFHQLTDAHEAASSPEVRLDLAAKLRLLNLLRGDLAAAETPIEELQPEFQAYFRDTVRSLHEATDVAGNPIEKQRLLRALEAHREATNSLAELATLKVLNIAFCTEVDSFGVVRKFPEYRFRAGDEVLLYCELENFVSRRVGQGFETRLQGNYEIVDQDGRRVLDQILPEDTDVCGNRRRDFYIAYRLSMPVDIQPGKYQLKLIIEDMQGHKFGQTKIDFGIK